MTPMKCRLRHRRPCDGPGDWHHVIPKARIKARVTDLTELPGAITDRRNLIPLCRRHHHRITNGWDRAELAEVLLERIDDLRAFAAAHGLEGALDRELRIYGLDEYQVVTRRS